MGWEEGRGIAIDDLVDRGHDATLDQDLDVRIHFRRSAGDVYGFKVESACKFNDIIYCFAAHYFFS